MAQEINRPERVAFGARAAWSLPYLCGALAVLHLGGLTLLSVIPGVVFACATYGLAKQRGWGRKVGGATAAIVLVANGIGLVVTLLAMGVGQASDQAPLVALRSGVYVVLAGAFLAMLGLADQPRVRKEP